MRARVVLVGHCGIDAPHLAKQVSRCLGKAEVITANSEDALEEALDEGVDLLLFNRELPFGFEETEGLELMREIRHRHPEIKMVLVSDRPEAQEEAEEIGALPGFGKSQLGTDIMDRCLRGAIEFTRESGRACDGGSGNMAIQ